MSRVREAMAYMESKEEFLDLYRRNIEVLENYRRNADAMSRILNEMRLGAMDQGWEITDEDLGG